jgi:hypothetical protein
MAEQKLILRDYQEGDEEIQAIIFNHVMMEMVPDSPPLTSETIKDRYAEHPEWTPKHVKVLVNPKDEIVGYAECQSRFGVYSLSYPLILKEYRSEESLHMLFRAIYEFAKNSEPKAIRATYVYEFEKAHEFLKSQQIAKIIETRETNRFSIPVDKLDFDTPGYTLKPFTEDDIEALVAFRYSKDEIRGGVRGAEMTVENLAKSFERGDTSPENSALVYQRDKLVGWWNVRINPPSRDYDRSLTHPVGITNGYAMDMSHEDMIGLRKALFKAGFQFLKDNNVLEFRIWVLTASPFFNHFKELGFEFTGEGEFVYEFE